LNRKIAIFRIVNILKFIILKSEIYNIKFVITSISS
jgi:hypothetical protein